MKNLKGGMNVIVCKKCGGEIEFYVEEVIDAFRDDNDVEYVIKARCRKCYRAVEVGRITFNLNLHLEEE